MKQFFNRIILTVTVFSHICMSWILEHYGDMGNEKAVELAKLAPNSELNLSYTMRPVSCVKRILKE